MNHLGLILYGTFWLCFISYLTLWFAYQVERENRARRRRGAESAVSDPSGVNTPDAPQIGSKVPPSSTQSPRMLTHWVGDDCPGGHLIVGIEEYPITEEHILSIREEKPCEPDSKS